MSKTKCCNSVGVKEYALKTKIKRLGQPEISLSSKRRSHRSTRSDNVRRQKVLLPVQYRFLLPGQNYCSHKLETVQRAFLYMPCTPAINPNPNSSHQKHAGTNAFVRTFRQDQTTLRHLWVHKRGDGTIRNAVGPAMRL